MANYRLTSFTFSASYTTGGEAFDPKGLADHPTPAVLPFPKSGYIFEFDPVNKKIKAYWGNYDSADGVLIEVPRPRTWAPSAPSPCFSSRRARGLSYRDDHASRTGRAAPTSGRSRISWRTSTRSWRRRTARFRRP